jgi:multiple sugar transport system permease protein
LARFPVAGKEFIFVYLLLVLIVPYQSLLTPIFFMFAQWHLTNTLVSLAIVHTPIQIPFSLYIIRNSFGAVPREIEEAAVIDGASLFQVLTRICLPAIRPAIVTVALFAFITSWNEFLGALVIMNRGVTFTLPLVLANARQETSIGVQIGGCCRPASLFRSFPACSFICSCKNITSQGSQAAR